ENTKKRARDSDVELPPAKRVYHGETLCEHPGCSHKAYYTTAASAALCGLHSKKEPTRKLLPKNPDAGKIRSEELNQARLAIQQASLENEKSGKIILAKQRMMKPLPMTRGYIVVLPNNRATSPDSDVVWAMPTLSPMRLGPVVHHQPGLPPSENIENFHQFNKVFSSEVSRNNIKDVWYERRLHGYRDKEPHRHKLGKTKEEHVRAAGGIETSKNANHCRFSVFKNPITSKEERYTYVQARMFYCSFYEQLATKTADFAKLVDAVYSKKLNIAIVGYDARDVSEPGALTPEAFAQW